MQKGLAVTAGCEISRDHDLLRRDHLTGHVTELHAVVLLDGRVVPERSKREYVGHHAEERVISLQKLNIFKFIFVENGFSLFII
jgi:hypothetical protein